jgi:tetratricopeptide (TPR) repeat protein
MGGRNRAGAGIRAAGWTVLAAAIAAVGLPAAPASADGPGDRVRGEEWYATASDLLDQGEARAALTLFENAYEVWPDWRPLAGMGFAYEAMGSLEEAVVCLEAALDLGGTTIPAEDREAVEAALRALRTRPAAPPAVPPTPSPPPAPPAVAPGEAEHSAAATWTWVLAGLAGALGAAGTGTGVAALVLDAEYHDPGTSPDRAEEIRPTGEALQISTDVLLAVAAGTAAAAILVWLLADDAESAPPAAVGPGPGDAGFSLAVRF